VRRTRLSFIVPFHRGVAMLERCLAGLAPLPTGAELFIAADGAMEDCHRLANDYGAQVIDIDGPVGPAAARNQAAARATGDVLVFVDADVVPSRPAIDRLERIFTERPGIAAAFGAYDEHPADAGFTSQFKNLSHCFVNKTAASKARTFWAGFGAVRRQAFLDVGGFDERFRRPAVEDIDLGYRLSERGHQILLDASLSACHLKRWTIRSAIVSDVRDRGVPWTQLVLRYGALTDDLNLRVDNRLSIVLAYAMVLALALAPFEPWLLAGLPLLAGSMTALHRRYYAFFYRKRGLVFTIGAWLLHLVHHLCNGVSFVAGSLLYICSRYCRLRLPGALAPDAWSASTARPAA
jgi:cellulose synthase/poly-beta-1,6-N-acetylglucosamine synthase-like glycosyltransferase